MGSRIGIITACKISVVRRNNRVLFALFNILTVPLSNTRATGIRQNNTTNFLKDFHLTVLGNSSSNLFRTWGDSKFRFCLQALVNRLLGYTSRTADILVR